MLALILLLLVFAELACCIWSMARLKSYVNLMDRIARLRTIYARGLPSWRELMWLLLMRLMLVLNRLWTLVRVLSGN